MVERGSLENCWRRKALVGSNPTPSVFVISVIVGLVLGAIGAAI